MSAKVVTLNFFSSCEPCKSLSAFTPLLRVNPGSASTVANICEATWRTFRRIASSRTPFAYWRTDIACGTVDTNVCKSAGDTVLIPQPASAAPTVNTSTGSRLDRMAWMPSHNNASWPSPKSWLVRTPSKSVRTLLSSSTEPMTAFSTSLIACWPPLYVYVHPRIRIPMRRFRFIIPAFPI